MKEDTKKTDTKKTKTNTKKTDVKKIKCYTCGKEMNENEAISYTVPSCCGVDEIKVCKKCSEELIKQGENEDHGCNCDCCR
ncbi:MAG: hypothetical protein CVT88_07195 [Candidatus Altiarchaeales archaeon HGW-Altiarchaeales-1]|nr:MAG: hypothetical protein CVT88_07195 [Candidatus Altiarchaeales archaeon HGW-Altiarchaeales-1]